MRVLSIVIPTLGRPSLEATLASIADQLADDDEVIVVADSLGDPVYAAQAAGEIVPAARFAVIGPGGDWGHTQRNWGLEHASGRYVWCLADDDVAAPGALAVLRAAAPDGWHVFRVRSEGELGRWTIPADRVIRETNIDAECILAPRGSVARWGCRYQGDLDYAVALQAELGEPVWHDEVVADLRPL